MKPALFKPRNHRNQRAKPEMRSRISGHFGRVGAEKLVVFTGKSVTFCGNLENFRGNLENFRGNLESWRGNSESRRGNSESCVQTPRATSGGCGDFASACANRQDSQDMGSVLLAIETHYLSRSTREQLGHVHMKQKRGRQGARLL